MPRITANLVASCLRAAIPRIACSLPKDVDNALNAARACETGELGAAALDLLCANSSCACAEHAPICQDTGTVWVLLEVGPDIDMAGNVFSQVDSIVGEMYESSHLRMSVVRDALFNRENSRKNTPAFTELHFVNERGVARLSVMLKGGGSDNASRVCMLTPNQGKQGIIDAVLDCVHHKAANACPPLIIGVGVGSTFDKVGGLAKRALLRPVGSVNPDPEAAEFERELLEAVNKTGIGAGALGGDTTALAVHVNTAPSHIAALPVAINMGCSAMRRATFDLSELIDLDDTELLVRLSASLDDQLIGPKPEASSAGESDAGDEYESYTRLELPLKKEDLAKLKAGQPCLLSGVMYTLRDAGHLRLLEQLEAEGCLPYDLDGQTIFYAGPTPALQGKPFGAIGPTTASRMDFAAPALYDAGIVATLGKGVRSDDVKEACKRNGCVYFVTVGGAAALLASCVKSGKTVAWPELGTEALRRITVKDLPVFVGVDVDGVDVYDREGA